MNGLDTAHCLATQLVTILERQSLTPKDVKEAIGLVKEAQEKLKAVLVFIKDGIYEVAVEPPMDGTPLPFEDAVHQFAKTSKGFGGDVSCTIRTPDGRESHIPAKQKRA